MPNFGSRPIALQPAIGANEPTWRTLASISADSSADRVVRVVAAAEGYGSPHDELRAVALCGAWWSTVDTEGGPAADPWPGTGALRFRVGSTPGVVRTLYADLRPGDYAFPACESLEVAAARWALSGPGNDADHWLVGAEIATGGSAESTPLRVTCRRDVVAANASAACVAPPGAYAFDIAGNLHIAPGIDQGVIASGGLGPVARNYTTGRWTPPTTPVLLQERSVIIERVSRTALEAGATWPAEIVFFVR